MWYGGGKLAADLTWPRLRQRWAGPGGPPGPGPVTAADRNAWWEHAAQVAGRGRRADPRRGPDEPGRRRATPPGPPRTRCTWPPPRWAAPSCGRPPTAFDRAARAQYGRIPAPSPAGNQLRQAARLIAASARLTRDPAFTPLVLIARLAALAEAVAELRQVQQRAAQAAAARTAARHLHAAARPAPAARPPGPSGSRTAARLAALSFPGPPAPGRPRQPAPGQPGPGRPAPRPARRPGPPRPPGPAP